MKEVIENYNLIIEEELEKWNKKWNIYVYMPKEAFPDIPYMLYKYIIDKAENHILRFLSSNSIYNGNPDYWYFDAKVKFERNIKRKTVNVFVKKIIVRPFSKLSHDLYEKHFDDKTFFDSRVIDYEIIRKEVLKNIKNC